MPQALRLEYACTEAEKTLAQNLSIRQQLGGGSKLRTWLILLLMVIGLILAAWFQFRDSPAAYRALGIIALFVGASVFVACKRIWRTTAPAPTTLEISEVGLTIVGADSSVKLPWSAFSQCLESDELFVLVDRTKTTLIVMPKRAFPNEESQTWFREQAAHVGRSAAPAFGEAAVLPASASPDRIKLTVQLGLRDYFDHALASWLTWGFWLTLNGLMLAALVNTALHPPPRPPVVSPTKVFFWVTSAVALLSLVMTIMVFSVCSWVRHRKYLDPQGITLSDTSLVFAARDAGGTIPWSRFAYYKETLWSFIIWRGWHWMMFPKRAFASLDDVNRCRELLDRNLERSRWFFGV
jgi:hypothetical protein